jgi:hypothetical protein
MGKLVGFGATLLPAASVAFRALDCFLGPILHVDGGPNLDEKRS